MTFREVEAICLTNSDMIANRSEYKDGWYQLDKRGYWCHYMDLSARNPTWSQEDIDAHDWLVLSKSTLRELEYRNLRYLTNE